MTMVLKTIGASVNDDKMRDDWRLPLEWHFVVGWFTFES
jgi:hypothetical protein